MTEILAPATSSAAKKRDATPISPLSTPPPVMYSQKKRPLSTDTTVTDSGGDDDDDDLSTPVDTTTDHEDNNSLSRRGSDDQSTVESLSRRGSNTNTDSTVDHRGHDDIDDDDNNHIVAAAAAAKRRRALSTPSIRAASGRKTAASINTEVANNAKLETLGLSSTPGGPTADASKSYICLCTPAPKVPRPRNAFILYRQHQQAQVVARNPGLANPDISKIIGELWREESEEVKDGWRRLAEEEKENHSRQHPNYRYQPRRGTRGPANGFGPASLPGGGGDGGGGEPGHCPKCGGRFIATPRTLSTAGFSGTPTTARPPMPQFPNQQQHPDSGSGASSAVDGRLQSQSQSSSQHAQPLQPIQPQHGHLPYRDVYYEADHDPASPSIDAKRRRYNNNPPPGAYHAMVTTQFGHANNNNNHGYPNPRNGRDLAISVPPQPSGGGGSGYGSATGPLPSPAIVMARGKPNTTMGPPPMRHPLPGHGYPPHPPPPSHQYPPYHRGGPPPHPHPHTHPHAHPHHNAPAFDESLRLPPLQVPRSPQHARTQGESRAHLAAAATPNPATSSSSSSSPPRGDTSNKSVEAMVMSIPFHNKMSVLRKISPTLAPTTPPEGDGASSSPPRGAVIAIEGANQGLRSAAAAVIVKAIRDSNEVALRTWASRLETPLPELAHGTTTTTSDDDASSSAPDMFGSYLRVMTDWHEKSREIVQHVTRSGRRLEDGTNTTKQLSLFPVALLPEGFSLTISDRFACAMPIADEYSPVDHWQWMATLWRGVVGPDLVVYVRECPDAEVARLGCVDTRAEGVMMVRVGESSKARESGLEEKVERRIAFEVMEWVRARGFS